MRGAREQDLPEEYQQYLAGLPTFSALDSMRWKIGSLFFRKLWQPATSAVQKGSRKLKGEYGQVPAWFLVVFDILLHILWFQHDFVFAPVFGRGDGR